METPWKYIFFWKLRSRSIRQNVNLKWGTKFSREYKDIFRNIAESSKWDRIYTHGVNILSYSSIGFTWNSRAARSKLIWATAKHSRLFRTGRLQTIRRPCLVWYCVRSWDKTNLHGPWVTGERAFDIEIVHKAEKRRKIGVRTRDYRAPNLYNT